MSDAVDFTHVQNFSELGRLLAKNKVNIDYGWNGHDLVLLQCPKHVDGSALLKKMSDLWWNTTLTKFDRPEIRKVLNHITVSKMMVNDDVEEPIDFFVGDVLDLDLSKSVSWGYRISEWSQLSMNYLCGLITPVGGLVNWEEPLPQLPSELSTTTSLERSWSTSQCWGEDPDEPLKVFCRLLVEGHKPEDYYTKAEHQHLQCYAPHVEFEDQSHTVTGKNQAGEIVERKHLSEESIKAAHQLMLDKQEKNAKEANEYAKQQLQLGGKKFSAWSSTL